jgi:hypothetical protein
VELVVWRKSVNLRTGGIDAVLSQRRIQSREKASAAVVIRDIAVQAHGHASHFPRPAEIYTLKIGFGSIHIVPPSERSQLGPEDI